MDATKVRSGKVADKAAWVLGRRTAQVLGVLALFAVVVVVLLALLDWYIAPADAAQKQSLVVTLAQILGGAALLSGLYFTWRTLQVNREGQITERFTRAIDQLGSKELEIRLGGIYALERIARDSERDHWPIMEVLTAYVRQHARWSPEGDQQGEEDVPVEHPEVDPKGLREESKPTGVSPPGSDIQAIMTVLRRRTRSYSEGEPGPLDLHETNLSQANLSGAYLTRADLSGANLSGANLSIANLSVANLTGADLSGAVLSGANLSLASLLGANLSTAFLFEAYLSGAMLSHANLSRANLSGVNLSGANLLGVKLSGAVFEGANLSGAYLLTQEQLEHTTGDENTQLPPHLKPPTRWGVKTGE